MLDWALSPLHNISFNHVFRIKYVESQNVTFLYAKQYSTSTQWEPQSGCHFLLQMSSSLDVYGAEQMPYEDRKLFSVQYDTIAQHAQLWIRSLEEKQKHIECAKKYAGAQDVSWWDVFFVDQNNIIDYPLKSLWPITMPFTWSFGKMNPVLCSAPLPDELKRLSQPEQ